MKRIGELYRMEAELRCLDPEARLSGRQKRSAPLIADTPVNPCNIRSACCPPRPAA
ncbi:hypothetical protein IB263_32070 [Ensifer sp. ENS03]|nr:hypothetical protein [Ensifer sp. ENS01]MBD9561040.1 hypothetical protein [Ensifer sp. ENS03]